MTVFVQKLHQLVIIIKGAYVITVFGAPKGKAWWHYWTYFKAWKRKLDEKIALLREISIWHPAWLGKLGVSINFRQFLSLNCAKNLRNSRILCPPWAVPFKHLLKIWNFAWLSSELSLQSINITKQQSSVKILKKVEINN